MSSSQICRITNSRWETYVPHSAVVWAEHSPEHPKFKSRICRHWLKGFCRMGHDCNFAHGWEERRAYENGAGKPEETFIENGAEKVEIITDWHILGQTKEEEKK